MSLNRRDFMGYLGVSGAALTTSARTQAQGPLPTSSRELWQLAQLQPVLDADVVWLDTAGGAPSLRSVLIEEYRQREALSRDRERYLREQCGGDSVRQLLGSIGQFLGTDVDSLALLSGATEALNSIAAGIDLTAGDEILATVHEHPASISPWLLAAKRRGVKLVQIELPHPVTAPEQIVAAFSAAITERTRVMSFSHVQYTDGCVMPVSELCALARAHSILSVVDGAQALGMLPLSVQSLGADFYAASFYKWLNGPVHAGALVFSPAARFRLWPLIVDTRSDWDGADAMPSPSAPATPPATSPSIAAGWPMSLRKFTASFAQLSPPCFSVVPSMSFQQEIGCDRVLARIRELAWYLRLELQRLPGVEIVTPAHPSLWAGIVSFRIPGVDGVALADALARRERIVLGFVRHPGTGIELLRACPHIYNDYAQLDRMVAALRRALRA